MNSGEFEDVDEKFMMLTILSTFSFFANKISLFSGRGYEEKSSLGPNCLRLTKILTMVIAFSRRDFRIRDKCPSCRAPMITLKAAKTADCKPASLA